MEVDEVKIYKDSMIQRFMSGLAMICFKKITCCQLVAGEVFRSMI